MTDTETIVYVRPIDARDLSYQRPQYAYEGKCPVNSDPEGTFDVICQVTSNVNESTIWCHDECADLNRAQQLRKCFQAQGTNFATVWQDTGIPNMTTGRVETDPKKFATFLADESKRMEDRLNANGGNQRVDYQPCDPTDTYVSDEGLDATHDRAVAEGRKDSRGRFVWTV